MRSSPMTTQEPDNRDPKDEKSSVRRDPCQRRHVSRPIICPATEPLPNRASKKEENYWQYQNNQNVSDGAGHLKKRLGRLFGARKTDG